MDRTTGRISLQISNVQSPGCILAREVASDYMSDEYRRFQELEKEMNDFFSGFEEKTNPRKIVKDQIYIGRRHGNKSWYRIEAREQTKPRTFTCHMLDYGVDGNFFCDMIYDAPVKYLEVPFQAKMYALAGVKPLTMESGCGDFDVTLTMEPATEWDHSTRVFLQKQFQGRSTAEAEVVCVDSHGVTHVQLYLKKGLNSICLNDELIAQKYAYAASNDKLDRIFPRLSKSPEPMGKSPEPVGRSPEPVGSGSKSPLGRGLSPVRSVEDGQERSPTPEAPIPGRGRGLALLKLLGTSGTGAGASGRTGSNSVMDGPAGRGLGRGHYSLDTLNAALKNTTIYDSSTSDDDRRKPFRTTSPSCQKTELSDGKSTDGWEKDENVPSLAKARAKVAQPNATRDGNLKNKPVPIPKMIATESSGSGVVGRLPHFAQASATRDGNLKNKPVPIPKMIATESSGVVGRLPHFATKEAKKTDSEKTKVTFSDGEELLGPRNDVKQKKVQPKKSILKVRSDSEVSSKSCDSPPRISATPPRVSGPPQRGSGPPPLVSDSPTSSPTKPAPVIQKAARPETSPQSNRPSRSVLRQLSDEYSSRDSSPEDDYSAVKLSAHYPDDLQYLLSSWGKPDANVQTAQPTASELRVLVDGVPPPVLLPDPSAVFEESICKVLDRLEITPTSVQRFSWSTFMRGRSYVAISCPYGIDRGGGTTFAYLIPLIQNLLWKSIYTEVPAGVGPLALILCSSWRRVHTVYNQMVKILDRDLCIRTVEIYGGGSETNQEVRLINGCDLLIATPKCLLRLVSRGVVEVKRICHLILDDGDNLMEKYAEEVKDLMVQYKDTLETFGDRATPQQLVVAAAHWTPGVQDFLHTYMTNAGVVIASLTEATNYTNVDKVVHVIRSDQRATKLVELLASSTQKRTLIFTNGTKNALFVSDLLQSYASTYCLLLHEDMKYQDQKDILREWGMGHDVHSQPIMVVTDNVLLHVEDAEIVIHYDPPARKQQFGCRLWRMNKNFKLQLQQSENQKGAVSILLVTEEWSNYVNLVIKDLKNSNMVVPQALVELAETVQSSKEQGKYTELCSSFKAYGFCGSENRCRHRHTIQKDLDTPGARRLYQKLPTRGEVKVFVTHVRDATCLWVRLLEHRDQGKRIDHTKDFLDLAIALPMHYGQEANRIPFVPERLQVGVICILKDAQQNYNRVTVTKIKRRLADRHLELFCQKIDKVQVRMVDIGSVLWVDQDELFVLDPRFTSHPYQAIEVIVCGVKPYDRDEEWTNQATDRITNAVTGQELEGRIVLALGNTLWLDPLVKRTMLRELGVLTHEVVCHREILDNNFALPNTEHVQLLYKACRGVIDLPEILSLEKIPSLAYDMMGLPVSLQNAVPKIGKEGSDYVEVTAVVHPGLFYTRLTANTKPFERMQYDILDYVKITTVKPESMEILRPGSLILSTFPYDEPGENRPWYRGKITGIENDTYDVLLLDTGESEYIGKDQVMPMPTSFKRWPFQAMECCLADLKPPNGDEWVEEVGDILWKMVSDEANKGIHLLMEVVDQDKAQNFGTGRYHVRLLDVNREYDVDLSQELAVAGHGRLTRELVMTDSPGVFVDQTCDIAENCLDILLDQSGAVEKSTELQRSLISAMQGDMSSLLESQAVGAMCQTIGYVNDAVITDKLCKCLVLISRKGGVEALLRGGCITNLCRMLARDDACIKKIATWTIEEISKQEISRPVMMERGVLRLLAAQLADPEIDDPECKRYIVQALNQLSQSVTDRSRMVILRSDCIQALSHHLAASTDRQVIMDTVDTLKQYIDNARLQEESRWWTLEVLCVKLETYWYTDSEITEHLSSALVTLSKGSRINKEALLHRTGLELLTRVILSKALTEKTQKSTEQLLDALTVIKGLENGGEEMYIQPDTDKQNPRRSKEEIKNTPLTQDELNVVVERMSPQVNWFQDRRNLILLVQVKSVSDPLDISIAENSIKFRAVVERVEYSFALQLYELVVPDKCETCVKPGQVQIGLKKVTKGNWPRVIKDRRLVPYLVPDFEHFIDESDLDEDEDEEESEEDHNESPLITIERGKPRPSGLPPPTGEHIKLYDQLLPYDPANDEATASSDDEQGDDDFEDIDDHEHDIRQNFFNI